MAGRNRRLTRWLTPLGAALLVVAALVWFFWPETMPVDLATVTRGPLVVSVEEDGRTRVMERYVISAPLAGNMLRVNLEAGDEVSAGQVVAWITPRAADPLDPRAFAEAQARVSAARSAVQQAGAVVASREAELARAARDVDRLRPLVDAGAATQRELDDAVTAQRVAEQALEAAQFGQRIAEYELETAEAAAQRLSPQADPQADTLFAVEAPCDGRVLRVMQESETVVTPGTPILEVGDPSQLEVEVDVLSNDAVLIEPGARVELVRWGGGDVLPGRVRLVEPSGFTKISALGVEEQRVNVIIDFVNAEGRHRLGDQFRVVARIVTWEADDVLQVPMGALFRSGDQWAVFRMAEGRAMLQPVAIGQMSTIAGQVLDGLAEGDQVVLHPSDRIEPGVRIEARAE